MSDFRKRGLGLGLVLVLGVGEVWAWFAEGLLGIVESLLLTKP